MSYQRKICLFVTKILRVAKSKKQNDSNYSAGANGIAFMDNINTNGVRTYSINKICCKNKNNHKNACSKDKRKINK